MKKCPVCGGSVKGRLGKIYCSTKCKSIAQYERRNFQEQLFIGIDRTLKHNRSILKRYNQSGFTTLRKQQLINEGLDLNYFTHYWRNSAKQVYIFCYDYGYHMFEKDGNEKLVIVQWQDYMKK